MGVVVYNLHYYHNCYLHYLLNGDENILYNRIKYQCLYDTKYFDT